MDNEEKPINWEKEAIFYKNTLETALEYQRQLEQTISQLQATVAMQAQRVNQQGQMINQQQGEQQLWVDYARKLEERLAQLKVTMDLQTKAIRTLAAENQEQVKRLKRRESSRE